MHFKPTKSLTTTLFDADGRKIEQHDHETDSIVTGFADVFYTQLANNDDTGQAEDITGTSRTIATDDVNFRSTGDSGVAGDGVHFGSGTTAVSYDDTDLASRFTSGVSYNDGSASLSETNSQSDIDIQRSITNTSGSTITAKEAGHVAAGHTSSGPNESFLIARDVLDTGVDIDPNQTLRGTYTYTFKL